MRSAIRSLTVIVACSVAVGAAGCSASPDVGSVRPGVPDGITVDPMTGAPAAGWIERGKTFAVVTMGSSSCPPVATAVDADGDDLVSVTFASSPNDPCTADMAPTTHEFDLPAGVTAGAISVRVRFEDWPDEYRIPLD